MKDWIAKLDDFLKISDREILTHSGSVSRDQAIDKARLEYEKYRKQMLDAPSPVERHFIEAIKEVKELEKQPPPRKKRKGKK
jgi:hypothetical protein